MVSKNECWAKASECVECAGRTRDAETKLTLYALARCWWHLAQCADQLNRGAPSLSEGARVPPASSG